MKHSIILASFSLALHHDGTRALLPNPPSSASSLHKKIRQHAHFAAGAPSYLHSTSPSKGTIENESSTSHRRRATHALLFSSWTDGIAPNRNVRSFLKYCLLRKMLSDEQSRREFELKSSAEFSPCCGPDIDALNDLECVDALIRRGQRLLGTFGLASKEEEFEMWSEEVLGYLPKDENHDSLDLRLLYIPTAMYALNPQSSNTPGKQRQRARADGKKRRDQIMNLLDELLNGIIGAQSAKMNVCAITLDLDDGSLKQPEGFRNPAFIPKDDKIALSEWNPHIIYVEGGNTFWLQHCIEKGNYSTLLKEACTGPNGSVYCGKSAGAIVAGKSIETATWKGWDDPSVVPGRESYDRWIGCAGLGFVGDESFFPHYGNQWRDLVKEKTASGTMMSDTTTCLHEEEVCCIVAEPKQRFVLGSRCNEELL
ncbi:hypothetical protein ACHAW6_005998 [Cyclotella cf. meneghiniana]